MFTKEEKRNGTTTRRLRKFDEDIPEIIEEVGVPSQIAKGVTPPRGKTIRIANDETLKGDRIVRYLKKTSAEERAFSPTRSLARSPPKDSKEGVASTSELDTLAEMSDSGSEGTGTREYLRKKAVLNRAVAEKNEDDDDNIVTKLTEWNQMTEIIKEVFLGMHGLSNWLYLTTKKGANIKKRRDIIKDHAGRFYALLNEVRSRKGSRMVRTSERGRWRRAERTCEKSRIRNGKSTSKCSVSSTEALGK